jgi:hypothetical protein
MDTLKTFGQQLLAGADPLRLQRETAPEVYPRSFKTLGQSVFFMARLAGRRVLAEVSPVPPTDTFAGEAIDLAGGRLFIYERTPQNGAALMQLFPFTKPVSIRDRRTTFGCGDRLGIATPGHIKAVRDYNLTPILAQQSIRELTLTGRTYPGVVTDAAWGVFQEDYQNGYGADGDHLKTYEEVLMAQAAGMTFVTIDLSEQIDNTSAALDAESLAKVYRDLPAETRFHYENRYLGKTVGVKDVSGNEIIFTLEEEPLARIVCVYHKAITQAIQVWRDLIEKHGLDYEISIDETLTPTVPEAHFVVANELLEAGVEVFSIAPRFCGEFQKGIDYIGDRAEFEKEFAAHAGIAAKLGYKLSIHTGSDKFSLLPIIGRHTGRRLHHKTAGTSWLQAMRLVASKDAALYREIHKFCLERYPAVKPLYHIAENKANVPAIETVDDDKLDSLFDNIDLRRIMHISYGLVLTEPAFRQPLYDLWLREEDAHDDLVASHLRRHFDELGIEKKG